MTRARRADKVARRDARWREQAARLIGQSGAIVSMASAADQYVRFNVALVRAYCERLIAEADALDEQREVFKDWTRDRGRGPEGRFPSGYWVYSVRALDPRQASVDVGDLRPGGRVWRFEVVPSRMHGAVVTARTMAAPMADRWRASTHALRIVAQGVRLSPDSAQSLEIKCVSVADVGGWPGNLAREYVAEERARRRCSRRDCDGGVLVSRDEPLSDADATDILGHVRSRTITWSHAMTITARGLCHECEAFKSARTSRAFVNGGNLRRAAQRLLDTLDGRCPWNSDAPAQPNECQACDGRGRTGPQWPVPEGVITHVRVPHGYGFDRAYHVEGSCIACNGTGHNIRGTLPPLPEETVRALNVSRIHGVHADIVIVDDLMRMTDDRQVALNGYFAETP